MQSAVRHFISAPSFLRPRRRLHFRRCLASRSIRYPPRGARRDLARASGTPPRDRPTPRRSGALGRVLHAWEQWEAAHEAYARAQALAPQAFDWPYLDASCCSASRGTPKPPRGFAQALAHRPDYLPARVKLAEALLEAGDLDESRRLFDALVREPAAEPAAEFGLGRIAAAEGHHDEAVAHLQRAIALFPEWGAAYYALALSYRALGRRDEAQRALERHAQIRRALARAGGPGARRGHRAAETMRGRAVQRGVKLAERRRCRRAPSRRTKRRWRSTRRSRRRTRT